MSRPAEKKQQMATFTIDTENNIAAHAAVPTNLDKPASIRDRKGAGEAERGVAWRPAGRCMEQLRRRRAFTDLKPVKKFTNRRAAVARIGAAVQRLSGDGAEEAAFRRAKAQKGATERSNKKAEVIAMMKRVKGATLAEIMEATGWQAHTVRGFVSILGSKGGEKIESSKNAAGERTYRMAK